MMKLNQLIHIDSDITIEHIVIDSRKVKANTLFFAMAGVGGHGQEYIPQAIEGGAVAVVSDQSIEAYQQQYPKVVFLQVDDIKTTLHQALKTMYSHDVHCIGITGTNGKTTVTYLVEALLKSLSQTCGVIGTIEYRLGKDILPSTNTTPSIVDNYGYLHQLASQHVTYCAMEVSSHALDQGRVEGIDFQTAVFMNLTGDHLDYHADMESYFQAKAKLFSYLKEEGCAIINADDPYGQKLIKQLSSRMITFGVNQDADLQAQIQSMQLHGTQLTLSFKDETLHVNIPLIGQHNVQNVLAAVGVLLSYGFALTDLKQGLETLPSVPGRLELVGQQDFHVFIDYAHTEDGLRHVLASLKVFDPQRIIVVFGCGGDRDKSKRPKMAAVAQELADLSVVTTDNCRSEDPQSIIDEVVAGFSKECYTTIVDRKQAIEYALSQAQAGDVVLVTGKGHEQYQILNTETIDFNERKIIEACLA